MKKNWKIISLIMALALAATLGVTSLAETAEVPAEQPAAEQTAAEPEAAEQPAGTAPAAEQAAPEMPQGPQAPQAPGNTADSELQDALNALTEARNSNRITALEAELKTYVEAGTLTQEQADVILKAYREQEALSKGVCPNCGYQFSNGGTGRNGRMNGNGMGGRMNGSGTVNGQANGAGGSMNGFGGMGGRGGHGSFCQPQNGTRQNTVPGANSVPDANGVPGTNGI